MVLDLELGLPKSANHSRVGLLTRTVTRRSSVISHLSSTSFRIVCPCWNMHNFQEETEGIEDDTPTELQSAAAAGDLTQVLSILNDKPTSVHDAPRGYYGLTALQFACQNVHIPCVLALLRAGANVNAPGGNNATRPALAIAAAGGDPDLVRLLLEWVPMSMHPLGGIMEEQHSKLLVKRLILRLRSI